MDEESFNDADSFLGKLFWHFTQNLAWNIFLTSTALHAIVLVSSPIQAVYKWYLRKSSDSDTPLPYIFAMLGSGLWLRYSLFIEDIKLTLLQSYAFSMYMIYLLMMLFYRSQKSRLLKSMLTFFLFLTSLILYAEKLDRDEAKMFIGRIASGAQIASSLVCPYLIYRAICTKVIDFVPFATVLFTWIMEIHAIIYSLNIEDFYMTIANMFFFTMDSLLLTMFFIYPRERNQKIIRDL